uniref:Hypothetical secreted protein n=1 Tax=Glossina morsitans morsitans TaxID=37546 RepID=D3TSM6_GLOMM
MSKPLSVLFLLMSTPALLVSVSIQSAPLLMLQLIDELCSFSLELHGYLGSPLPSPFDGQLLNSSIFCSERLRFGADSKQWSDSSIFAINALRFSQIN